MLLYTAYETGKIPHSEHPNPQCERDGWLCLNGEWELKRINPDGKCSFSGKIIVPFSPETLLGGIGGEFILNEEQSLVYKRTFLLNEEQTSGRVMLRFGAVDSRCSVAVNGVTVGSHACGFTPFSFDVTSVVKAGENSIEVTVIDDAFKVHGARGKQSKNRGTIWYTPQSGIYQTVWLEFSPTERIENLKITPDAFNKSVKITFDCKERVTAVVFDGDKEILRESNNNEIEFKYDFILWSPENPKLYTLLLTNPSGDRIKSYFGVRSFSIVTDKKGKKRLALNGKPYFFNGVLDQGYWSDGMLTYPSDKAAEDELKMLKDMGFNTVRKHIKVEPMRWYYHCDRLGLIVWQDFVNGGGEYKDSHIRILPFLGFNHRDDDYKYFARESEYGRSEYIQMVKDIINALYNSVSVGAYVPFNEGWGQFDSKKITDMVKSLDNTRIVDSVSGWHDQGRENSELLSLHIYFTPLKVPKDDRAVVLSEFGGYSMKVDGHVYDDKKEYGYKRFRDKEKFLSAIKKLYLKMILPLLEKGLSGAIYTQVSDVEEEINGIVTYDRKVQKIPTAFMREINQTLYAEWKEKIE